MRCVCFQVRPLGSPQPLSPFLTSLCSPAHHVAMDLAKMLLEAGADVNAQDRWAVGKAGKDRWAVRHVPCMCC